MFLGFSGALWLAAVVNVVLRCMCVCVCVYLLLCCDCVIVWLCFQSLFVRC